MSRYAGLSLRHASSRVISFFLQLTTHLTSTMMASVHVSSSSDECIGSSSSESFLANVHLLGFKAGRFVRHVYVSYVQQHVPHESTGEDFAFPRNTDFDSATASTTTTMDVVRSITQFPALYKSWWVNLYYNDPVHVVVETTLLLSIVYILVSRSKDWREDAQQKEKLTDKEKEDLLREWKQNRAPLSPILLLESESDDTTNTVVVHAMHGRTMDVSFVDHQQQHHNNGNNRDDDGKHKTSIHTVLNFATFDFLGMSAPAPDTAASTSTPHKKTSVVASLAGTTGANNTAAATITPNSSTTTTTAAANSNNNHTNATATNNNAATATNTSSTTNNNTKENNNDNDDVIIMNTNPVKESARQALDRYGCGSCGPRGFYGTVDVHLHVETAVSRFLGTEAAILYSDGASAAASTVAAFCKRGDLIVADAGVYEPLRSGIQLSRAHVKWFAHNDMDDLAKVLAKVRANDKKLKRPLNAQRRFLVVEGLYKNSGAVCPLDELIQLKREFSYRLILDESFSFGTLGQTGRGVTEEYNNNNNNNNRNTISIRDAEIVTFGLENSMGSVGGITVGTEEVVDHQRLSGSGYCFSASSPPFAATAAMTALELLEHGSYSNGSTCTTNNNDGVLQRLNDNRTYLYEKLKGCHFGLQATADEKETASSSLNEDNNNSARNNNNNNSGSNNGLLQVTSDERSPICFLHVADIPETEYLDDLVFLREVVKESLAAGCAFTAVDSAMVPTTTGTTKQQRQQQPPQKSSTTYLQPPQSAASMAGATMNANVCSPAIRIAVNASHTFDDVDKALEILRNSVDVIMNRFHEEVKEEEED